jgi:integrase
MTGYVFKPSRRKNGKVVKSRLYSGRYRRPGQSKITTVAFHVTDRDVAEQKLRELIRDIEKEEMGIRAPKRMRIGAQTALADHIAAFCADLRARGRDLEYVDTIQRRLKKLSSECGWNRLIDVTGQEFQVWRGKQAKSAKSLAAKTLNDYLAAISQLFAWLLKSEVIERNPLTNIGKVEGRGNERRKRRALTPEALTSVIAIAGRYRLAIVVAYYTGLRRNELRQLEWDDVRQEEGKIFIVARASTTKNRRAQRLYLPLWFARELLDSKSRTASGGSRVFAKDTIPSMWQFKRLLTRAGVPYKDEQGRQADFHALRRTANTHLANAGVDPQTRQEIMRHSEIALTLDVYTDKGMLPIDGAVEKLPMFPRERLDAHPCAHNPDFLSQPLARDDIEKPETKMLQTSKADSERQPRSHPGTIRQGNENGCLARIRT